jgi:hypothetical protein
LDNASLILPLAKQVIDKSNRLTEIWSQLDYHSRNGVMMEKKQIKAFNVEELELSEIITRLLNLPSYLTKTKRKLSKMHDCAEKEVLKREYELKKSELQAIKDLRYRK